MPINRFYTTTFSIKRMHWDNESSAEITNGSFVGHIQQSSPEAQGFTADMWGKVFTVWCSKDADVQLGDTLTIATGDYAGTYQVKNKQLNATGANEHLEVSIIRDVI